MSRQPVMEPPEVPDWRLGYHDPEEDDQFDNLGRPQCHCGYALKYHPRLGEMCRPDEGYHSTPHRGCILR